MRVIGSAGRAAVFSAIVVVAACAVFSRSLSADSFNWANLDGVVWPTPVKTQFGGTCWAFAAVGTFEARYKLTRNDPLYSPDLSEQQLVWETNPDLGSTDGGYTSSALSYMCNNGVVSEATCPYQSSSPNVGISPWWPLTAGSATMCWKCTTTPSSVTNTTAGIKAKLNTRGPLLVNVYASNDLFGSVSSLVAAVNSGTTSTYPGINHSVVITGYVDDASLVCGGYWIIKNSWGTGSGTAGYYFAPYGYVENHNQIWALTGTVYYTGSMSTATWGGGGGTWVSGGSSNWNFSSGTSGGTYTTWQNEEISAGFDAAGSTVTLSGPLIAHGLSVTGSGYVFNGGSLTVTGDGITTTQDVAFNAPITIGAYQTWTIAGGKTMTVTGAVHTVISNLTLANNGTLYLAGGIDGGGALNARGAAPGSIIQTGTGTTYITGTANALTDLTVSAGQIVFSGGTLQLGRNLTVGSSTAAAFTQTNGSVSIASYLYLGSGSGGAGTYTLNGSASLLIAATERIGYSGAGTFTQTAGTNCVSGSLTLGYSPGVTGVYNLNGGVLAVGVLHQGDGTAAFNFGGGTLRANCAFSSSLPMNLTGTGGDASVDTAGYAGTLSGTLSGTGGLVKTGAGTLTVSAASAYTGATTVSAGALRLTGSIASSSGVSVAGGSLVLAGGTAASVSVASGASLAGYGAAGSVIVSSGGIIGSADSNTWGGQLSVAGLNLAGDSSLSVGNLAGYAATAAVNVTQSGGLACAGQVTVNVYGTVPAGSGTATLIQYSGAVAGSLSYTLGGVSFANSRSVCTLFTSAGGSLSFLNASYTFDHPYWTGLAGDGGIWSTGTAGGNRNWKLAASGSQTDYLEGDLVLFDDRVGATSATVTLGQNLNPVGVTFNNSSSTSYTITGGTAGYGITGAATLTKNGAGTATLLGANSYSGATAINAGALNIQNAAALGAGAVTVGGSGTLQFQGGISLANNVTLDGILESVSGANTCTGSITVNSTGSITVDADPLIVGGVISGTGSLYKAGSGTLTFSGSVANTIAMVRIRGGTLQIGAGGAAGSITGNVNTGNMTVGSGTLVFNRSDAYSFGGSISGYGALMQLGSGTLTLMQTNSYTGPTTLSAGVLAYGADGATASGSLLISGGTLSLGSYSGTAGSVTLASGVIIGTGGLTSTGGFSVSSGTISAPLGGAVPLIKSGSGTVTLAVPNVYTGGSTLSDGCLVSASTGTTFGSGTLTLSGGTLCDAHGAGYGTGTPAYHIINTLLASTGKNTYFTTSNVNGTVTDSYFSGSLTGSGSITNASNANYLWLRGHNDSFSGTFVNQAGSNNCLILSYTYSCSANAAWVINSNARAYGVTGTISLGALAGTSTTAYLGGQSTTNVTYSIGALNTSTTFAGHIYDGTTGTANGCTVGVSKVGTGTLTLAGSSLYTGGTTINGGALVVGDGASAGSLSGSVVNNGILAFNRSNAYTFAGLMSGSGALRQLGSGTLTLSQTNTYTGSTTVGAGVLAYGAVRATGTGDLAVSGGTLSLGSYSGTAGAVVLTSGAITGAGGTLTSTAGFSVSSGAVSAVLAGSVGLTKSTAGTVTLSGANVYTGTSCVNAGTLMAKGAAAIAAVLAPAATTDIAAGKLVLDYTDTGAGDSISSQVNTILAAGYNSGTNSWASGIIHSTLANTNSYTLGWTNNTASNTVMVQVALYGDATLDGTVNINDLGQVLASYNQPGVWAAGDFNYDGTVNIYDLGKVLANYNQSLDLSGTSLDASGYSALDGDALAALQSAGVNVVPEPGTLALLGAGLAGLAAHAWRRRKQPASGHR
jgi:autotransporter-associated beta strand protein